HARPAAGADPPDGLAAAGAPWVAGVIHHAAWDELAACLASLAAQREPPRATLVVDTGVAPERLEPIRRAHPAVHFEVRENRGWGAGVNRVLAWAAAHHPDVPFVLLLSPDVALEPDYGAVLAAELAAHPRV